MAFWPWEDFVATSASLLKVAKSLRFQADLCEVLESTVGENPGPEATTPPSRASHLAWAPAEPAPL